MALFAARQFYSKTAALNPVLLKGWSPTAASSSSAEGLSYAIEHTTDLQVEVVAVACAGTDNDLMQQMKALDDVSGKMGIFPSILPSSLVPKRTFGELCREHLDIWRQLQRDAGIDFDLIYAPRAFEHVIASFRDNPEYWEDCGIIYYHCGGVEGNESQLGRYRHNKLL
jgi:1-aminocyclopropane-1-carboxylate deaminase/D-cysteine desulfhydrase-like pyridoxal-dependent ACC family enzyme